MTHTAPQVLILGAHGRLGAAATQAFINAGWRVRAQSRRPSGPSTPALQPLSFDANDRESMCHAAQGVDVILNALNPLYTRWEQDALPLADNALAAARRSGALLLFPGNVYNFGSDMPDVLRHDTPWVGNTPKARIRMAIEHDLSAAAFDGVDSVVVRAGDYFGGGGRGNWFDLVIAASLGRGKLVWPGPTHLAHAWAYVPDLAQTFVLLAQQRQQLSGAQLFHFAGHTFSGEQMHAHVEALMARRIRLDQLNWGLLRVLGLVSPMMRATVAMRYLWQRPHRLEDTALGALLGTVPHTPLPDALAAALRELQPGVSSANTHGVANPVAGRVSV